MTPSRLLLPASLVLAFLPAAQARTPALPDAAAVQRYAQELLDAQGIAPDGPGLTLLVARDKDLLVNTARGMASIELGVPLKAEHQMRLGSVTKQFAAATLLRLIDEGKAKLDDPLSKYLPDYPNGAAITLAQLLDHSSGVNSYTGIPGYMGGPIRRDLTTPQLVAEFKDLPVDFAPGAQHRYNNSGYVLVGAVIEAITGKPWHEAVQQLAGPTVKLHYPMPDRIIPGHAEGYSLRRGAPAPAMLISMTQPHAAGALVSNTEALWRWNQQLHEGGLLKPETYKLMTTPQGVAKAANYGYSIAAGSVRGMPLLQHGGGIPGFSTTLQYLPQQRVTVAILRNSDGGGVDLDSMARRLMAFAAGQSYPALKPVPVAADLLKAYEGVYAFGNSTRQLKVVDGKLVSQRSGNPPLTLLPLGNDRFAFSNSVAQLQFLRGADGKVNAQRFFPDADEAGGGAETWARSGDIVQRPEIALDDGQRQALLGDYVGAQLQIKVFVDAQGVLRGQVPGQPAVALKATSARELFITEVDASLSFAPAEGPVKSVTLLQGPARIEMAKKP